MEAMGAHVYNDFHGLANLKADAERKTDGSIDEVARQFESLFLQMMLKGMRDASLGEGIMDNDQTKFYEEMFDQQLSLNLAGKGGIGLADVIKRQLGGGDDLGTATTPVRDVADYRRQAVVFPDRAKSNVPLSISRPDDSQVGFDAKGNSVDPKQWSQKEFVQNLWPMAQKAAKVLGVEPQALVAQAALETGWGNHVMKFGSGKLANNLFGIKADQRWEGPKVRVSSLEYADGIAVNKQSYFRAYDSLEESFLDYADFIQSNPRYETALEKGGESEAYFTELQRAGYATDPKYANKINTIVNGSAIQDVMRSFKFEDQVPL